LGGMLGDFQTKVKKKIALMLDGAHSMLDA
jgi:hypothetical protein